jgi:hypothetical protein
MVMHQLMWMVRVMRVRTAIIAFGMCAVTVAGCASSAHPELATPPAVPSPGLTTVIPPSARSPTAYQAALRSADTTMAPAFDRLTTAWDNQLKTFTRSCQFERFEQNAEFNTISVKDGIEYTVQAIGLKPAIDGNARTEAVPAQSFPW